GGEDREVAVSGPPKMGLWAVTLSQQHDSKKKDHKGSAVDFLILYWF
ncbi:hypothetical protein A2U01_0026983, partial [Trifolium medium]|nr:hypothetical protein [Trifolium medium]